MCFDALKCVLKYFYCVFDNLAFCVKCTPVMGRFRTIPIPLPLTVVGFQSQFRFQHKIMSSIPIPWGSIPIPTENLVVDSIPIPILIPSSLKRDQFRFQNRNCPISRAHRNSALPEWLAVTRTRGLRCRKNSLVVSEVSDVSEMPETSETHEASETLETSCGNLDL